MESSPQTQQLTVKLEGGKLVISVGIGVLCNAIAWPGDLWERVSITDPDQFAKELVRYLEEESEDGTTRVHRALDSAALEALEQGAEGIELGPQLAER